MQVVIYSALLGSLATLGVSVEFYNTALATLAGAGVNLLAGGAAGQAKVYTGDAAYTPVSSPALLDLPANQSLPFPQKYLGELSPGKGIVFRGTTYASVLHASFLWVEL